MAQASRPCNGCGALIYRTAPVAPIRHYCSADCRPRCSIDGCEKPVHSKDMCSAHSTRAVRFGDPLAPLQRQRNVGTCSVEGCDQPSRKRGWCASHYALWQRTGEVRPFRYKWAPPGGACKVCDAPCPDSRRRGFCSGACAALWSNHDGQVPESVDCVICGGAIDLVLSGKGGRRKRSDTKSCRRCRQDARKHGVSVLFLAQRDGAGCKLCDKPIDMTLRYPEKMRASVDHIVPRAHGGTNDPDNLQLTHLWCNQIKQGRIGFRMTP